jgi:tRNA(Ile)-lysidine synthase
MNQKFIFAFSAGVDSVVLLDLILKGHFNTIQANSNIELAYINHGIRSAEELEQDMHIVKFYANKYNLKFIIGRVNLNFNSNEEEARLKRYEELEKIRVNSKADLIILAHHKQDKIESALLNLIRGTGWRGLCSLVSEDRQRRLIRPFLLTNIFSTKSKIVEYANQNNLIWHEDSTNNSINYTRNRLRMVLNSASFNQPKFNELGQIITSLDNLKKDVDPLISEVLKTYTAESRDGSISFNGYNILNLPQIIKLDLIRLLLTKSKAKVNTYNIKKVDSALHSFRKNNSLDLGFNKKLVCIKKDLFQIK